MGHFAQGFFIVTMFSQAGEKFWHSGDITELQRYGSAIKIGAQGHMFYTNAFGYIIDVAHDFRQRCFRIQAAVGPQERNVEINANHAIRFADGIQLFIC